MQLKPHVAQGAVTKNRLFFCLSGDKKLAVSGFALYY